jgi:hypothetical protein
MLRQEQQHKLHSKLADQGVLHNTPVLGDYVVGAIPESDVPHVVPAGSRSRPYLMHCSGVFQKRMDLPGQPDSQPIRGDLVCDEEQDLLRVYPKEGRGFLVFENAVFHANGDVHVKNARIRFVRVPPEQQSLLRYETGMCHAAAHLPAVNI